MPAPPSTTGVRAVAAGRYDILFERGADFERLITVVEGGSPLDLTGYDARMQVRRSHVEDDVIIELTIANGRITFPVPTAGQIRLSVPGADHATAGVGGVLLPPTFDGVHDLELVTPGGGITRLIQGAFMISPEVTR